MPRNSLFAILFLLLAGLFIAWPGISHADVPASNELVCPGYEGLSGKIVNCVRDTVIKAANAFLVQAVKFFRPIIIFSILISMTIFGMLIVTGQLRSPLRDTFVLLFKIIGVLVATQYFTEIFVGAIDISKDALTIVSQATAQSTTLSCGGDATDIWKRVDCAVEKIIGIGFSQNVVLTSGIIGMITTILFSASWGIFIALLAIAIVLLLVLTIAEAIYIYLNAFIALACMAMMAPLIIPMVLFTYTRGMFDRWLKMSLGFILQPMFLFAYLSLMLTAFDTTVLFGKNSLYTAITNRPATQNSAIGKYFLKEDQDLYIDAAYYPLCVDTDPTKLTPSDVITDPTKTYGVVGNYVSKTGTQALCDFSSSLGIGFDYTAIDVKKWSQLHGLTEKQLFKKILVAFALAALVAYVMHSTLGYIPMMGTEVAGGLLDGVNLSRVGRMPGSTVGKMISGGK